MKIKRALTMRMPFFRKNFTVTDPCKKGLLSKLKRL
jgi:hypothetical protein